MSDTQTVAAYLDEITRLNEEVERLRAALEDVLPLAESYLNIMPDRRGVHAPKIEAARAALSGDKHE